MFTMLFTIPGAAAYEDLSLLVVRLVLALVFGTSGYGHLRHPQERAKSIEMSVGFTALLGAAELAGAVALAIGLLAPWAGLGLILVMLGAIYKKAAKWKTGFWGEKSMGWHYEVLMIAMLFVIVTMGAGRYSA